MNPTDPNPLLPCPFCGSYDITGDHDGVEAWRMCDDCGAHGPKIDRKEITIAWNTRAPSAELTQAQAAGKDLLEQLRKVEAERDALKARLAIYETLPTGSPVAQIVEL